MDQERLENGVKIKIIGDSVAAGAGSSMSYETDELIFEDDGIRYFKRVAPNSWWGLLEQYIQNKYQKYTIENKGCSGAFSYQIRNHLDTLISSEDQLVLILMGLNDRKRQNGMEELRNHCEYVVDHLTGSGKVPVLLTPNPSAFENEHRPSRIYHTEEVVQVLQDIAHSRKVLLADNYRYIEDYLAKNQLTIDHIIYGQGCDNDGLHPSDSVQKLMFQNLMETLQI